mgnify:CR=1 FL=1|tara:strand:+ start:174 stop:623 length:450 start_codon:yes stop_codon:yes gene_type:complete
MAIIPNGQKILTSAAEVNTTYSGPASLQALNTWYTMDDISNTVRPYKVYTALLNQSGTSDPVAIVLENTLNNENLEFRRDAVGVYNIRGGNGFTTDKTALFITSNNSDIKETFQILYSDTNNLYIYTKNSGNSADDLLQNTTIEIRVYN